MYTYINQRGLPPSSPSSRGFHHGRFSSSIRKERKEKLNTTSLLHNQEKAAFPFPSCFLFPRHTHLIATPPKKNHAPRPHPPRPPLLLRPRPRFPTGLRRRGRCVGGARVQCRALGCCVHGDGYERRRGGDDDDDEWDRGRERGDDDEDGDEWGWQDGGVGGGDDGGGGAGEWGCGCGGVCCGGGVVVVVKGQKKGEGGVGGLVVRGG